MLAIKECLIREGVLQLVNDNNNSHQSVYNQMQQPLPLIASQMDAAQRSAAGKHVVPSKTFKSSDKSAVINLLKISDTANKSCQQSQSQLQQQQQQQQQSQLRQTEEVEQKEKYQRHAIQIKDNNKKDLIATKAKERSEQNLSIKLPCGYQGQHPHFKHHTTPAYYTDLNLRIHTPKADDVTALNENYRSVYNTLTQLASERRFPKASTPTILTVSNKELSNDEVRESYEQQQQQLESKTQKQQLRSSFFRGTSADNNHRKSLERCAKLSPTSTSPVKGDLETVYQQLQEQQLVQEQNQHLQEKEEVIKSTELEDHLIQDNQRGIDVEDASSTSISTGRGRNSQRFARKRAVRVRSESRPISALYDIICKEKGLDIGTSSTNDEDSSPTNKTSDNGVQATMSHKIPLRNKLILASNQEKRAGNTLTNAVSTDSGLVASRQVHKKTKLIGGSQTEFKKQAIQTKYASDDEDFERGTIAAGRRPRLLKSSHKRRTNTVELGVASYNAGKILTTCETEFNTNFTPSSHNLNHINTALHPNDQSSDNALMPQFVNGSTQNSASSPIVAYAQSNDKSSAQRTDPMREQDSSNFDGTCASSTATAKRFITRSSHQTAPSTKKTALDSNSSRSRSASRPRAINGATTAPTSTNYLIDTCKGGRDSVSPSSPPTSPMSERGRIAVKNAIARVRSGSASVIKSPPTTRSTSSYNSSKSSLPKLQTTTKKQQPTARTAVNGTSCSIPTTFPDRRKYEQNCSSTSPRQREGLTPKKRKRSISAHDNRLSSSSGADKEKSCRPRSQSLENRNSTYMRNTKLVPSVMVSMKQNLNELHFNGAGHVDVTHTNETHVPEYTIRLGPTSPAKSTQLMKNNEFALTEERPRCSTMISGTHASFADREPVLNLSPVATLNTLANRLNTHNSDKSAKRKSNLNRSLNEEATQDTDRRRVDALSNILQLESEITGVRAQTESPKCIANRSDLPKPLTLEPTNRVKTRSDTLPLGGGKLRSNDVNRKVNDRTKSDLAEIRKIAQMANEPTLTQSETVKTLLNSRASPVKAVNELRDSIERIRASHERELTANEQETDKRSISPVKHAKFMDQPVILNNHNNNDNNNNDNNSALQQRILMGRSFEREGDGQKLSPILRRKSTDDPADVTLSANYMQSHIVSILKKKDHNVPGESSSASSNASPVTFSSCVTETVAGPLKLKRAGILKKRSSLDESRYYSRSHSPDERSILIKSARRNSLEESAAAATNIHGILKQSSYDSCKSDGYLSAYSNETQHPQGILKKKDSTSTPSDSGHTTSKHVSISQAVILAAAELNREPAEHLDSAATGVATANEVFTPTEEIEIRPILKVESSSSEEASRPPKPILKKKSSGDSDEHEIRPILKTSRKSSREEYEPNFIPSDDAAPNVMRPILKTDSPSKRLSLSVDPNGTELLDSEINDHLNTKNALKRRTRSLERQDGQVFDLAEALNAIATSKSSPIPAQQQVTQTISVAERIKYMEGFLKCSGSEEPSSINSLPVAANTSWHTETSLRPSVLRREIYRERYKTQPITSEERNHFKIEHRVPLTEDKVLADPILTAQRLAFKPTKSLDSFNYVPFDSAQARPWSGRKYSPPPTPIENCSLLYNAMLSNDQNVPPSSSDALETPSTPRRNPVSAHSNMLQQLHNRSTTNDTHEESITPNKKAEHQIPNLLKLEETDELKTRHNTEIDDEVANKGASIARSRSGFVGLMPTDLKSELQNRLKRSGNASLSNLRKSATTDIKAVEKKQENSSPATVAQHADTVNLVRNLVHLGCPEIRKNQTIASADIASTSEGESSGGREISDIIKNSAVSRRHKLNDGNLIAKSKSHSSLPVAPVGGVQLPPLSGFVQLRHVESNNTNILQQAESVNRPDTTSTKKTATETTTNSDKSRGLPVFLQGTLKRSSTQAMGPDQRTITITENSSIADRLAALQKRGEDDWRKRISKREEIDEIRRENLVNDTISLAHSLSEKPPSSSPLININVEGGKVSDRLGKLQVSAANWKNRVEQSDVVKFISTPRLQDVQQTSGDQGHIERTNNNNNNNNNNESENNGKCAMLEFCSANPDKLGLDKSASLKYSTNDQLHDLDDQIELQLMLEEQIERKIQRSNGITERNNSDEDSKKSRVFVPQTHDAESFEKFFSQTKDTDILCTENDFDISDFDFIKSSERLITKRAIKGPKGRRAVRNPIKLLAAREDIEQEYTENRLSYTDPEEKEETMTRPTTFAEQKKLMKAEALAALASTENFRNVHLKSSLLPIISMWEPYKSKMLLHIKGRSRVQTRMVEPNYKSLNQGDCFLLVSKEYLFVYMGSHANVIELDHCRKLCSYILDTKDLGCCAAAEIILHADSSTNNPKQWQQFTKLLDQPDNYNVPECGIYEEDEYVETNLIKTNRIYELKNNTLQPLRKYWGCTPKYKMLTSQRVMVFDFGAEVYVWNGKYSTIEDKRIGIKLAQEYYDTADANYVDCAINPINYAQSLGIRNESASKQPKKYEKRPDWCLMGRFHQNLETILFKKKFSDWPEFEPEALEKDYTSERRISYIEPLCGSTLYKAQHYEEPKIILENLNLGRGDCNYDADSMRYADVITKELKKWQINEFTYDDVRNINNAHFYFAETYIIRRIYQIAVTVRELSGNMSSRSTKGRDRSVYYCWQGSDASANECGAAALWTVELDKEKGAQIRVVQGEEDTLFIRLFEIMFVHMGTSNLCSTRKQHWRLYQVLGNQRLEIKVIEVDCKSSSLRSRASMILIHGEKGIVYVWHGCQSAQHTRELCTHAAQEIAEECSENFFTNVQEVQIIEQEEADESTEFIEAIGGLDQFDSYSLLRNKGKIYDYTLRLFHFTRCVGIFKANEQQNPLRTKYHLSPYPFQQKLLYEARQPTVFMLDDGDTLWIWLGWWPKENKELVTMNEDSTVITTVNRSGQNISVMERRAALETAVSYWDAKFGENKDECCAIKGYCVWAGLEPSEFKALFPMWKENPEVRALSLADGRQEGAIPLTAMLTELTKTEFPLSVLLQRPLPESVDPTSLELYLNESDFLQVFGMTKEEFSTLPIWKQNKMKKDRKLF